MKRQLRKGEVRIILDQIDHFFPEGIPFRKKDRFEILDDKVISVDGEPRFFMADEPVPLLRYILNEPGIAIPRIIVDMGAVKFVTSGADVMRPGIVRIDQEISKGNLVVVADEKYGKPLAIGRALVGSRDMENLLKGKSVSIIHYVGDSIWSSYS